MSGTDVGPGMCLIDRWVRKRSKKNYDENGIIAKSRRINIKALHLSDFTGNLYIKIKTMIIKIFKEDQFMIIWLMAQLLLVLSRVIQVLGILYFFNLKKKIYEFFLLLIFFIPTIYPVLSLGTIRYRAPLEPLLILLTIAGLYFLRNIIHKKSN